MRFAQFEPFGYYLRPVFPFGWQVLGACSAVVMAPARLSKLEQPRLQPFQGRAAMQCGRTTVVQKNNSRRQTSMQYNCTSWCWMIFLREWWATVH